VGLQWKGHGGRGAARPGLASFCAALGEQGIPRTGNLYAS
jgi:hypothetical protein